MVFAFDPVEGAYSALQTLYLHLRGLRIRGGEGTGKKGKERAGVERGEEGRAGKEGEEGESVRVLTFDK